MACLDLQKAIVAGLAFSIGLGMKHHNIFEDLLVGPWGTAAAIALSAVWIGKAVLRKNRMVSSRLPA